LVPSRVFRGTSTMTKSELIALLASKQAHLQAQDVEFAVNAMLRRITEALASGKRVEIRGFGSFSLHLRPARIGRNPKTGEPVALAEKHIPRFKPGKEMRERVTAGA
jgi:integration host factor subunit beta